MTNLNFQAKNQLGQPAVAGNEGGEDRPIDQPKFPGKNNKKKQLGQPPVAGNEGIEDRPIDQPKFCRQEHPAHLCSALAWRLVNRGGPHFPHCLPRLFGLTGFLLFWPKNLGWSIGRSSIPSLPATGGWPNCFFAVFAWKFKLVNRAILTSLIACHGWLA